MDYLDVQVSLDGARAETNDPVRGPGSFDAAETAMRRLHLAGFEGFKLSAVVTRLNAGELDELLALASRYGAQLRLARLRPAGRGARTWHELRPSARQLVELHRFLLDHPEVLTGDSFFHLGALGEPLAGLNMCGAGRVVCLVDPVGDVYACPFVMHPEFRAGSIRDPGGFRGVWRGSQLFTELREPTAGGACNACGVFESCHGGCMAAKFFTGLPIDGPDPECVLGHGEMALARVGAGGAPSPGIGHSKPGDVQVALSAAAAVTSLVDPVKLGRRQARNRLVFGPHETNLARRRALSDRHVAYYRERASGGAGVIVVEEASVDDSDWPYERAPLAAEAAEGWARISLACRDEGALVIAALGHAGGQGSSAYHQRVLLGPSRVADVETREVPKEMDQDDLEALLVVLRRSCRGRGPSGL